MPRFQDLGNRLKAYRLGCQLTAEDVGKKLGVSRAAVYRIEAGDVVKIETIEKLAEVLGTSIASLLGVSVEYYGSAIAYFERMRQLEQEADQIVAYFPPFSYLLTTDGYAEHVRTMLIESMSASIEDKQQARCEIDNIITILNDRKGAWRRRRLSVINILTLSDIDRFLKLGAVGRFDLPPEEMDKRRRVARLEVENILRILIEEPMGIQIAVVDEPLPNVSFQLFRSIDRTSLALSPFSLGGELPNFKAGIAMLTSMEEPVHLYEKLANDLWKRAHKGRSAVEALEAVLARSGIADTDS
jgi:transcriptional regulator with XRE-family HTH domain